MFFAVAAVWGFLAGVAAILIGLAAAGRPAAGGTMLWLAILAALVVAVLGAMVAARAYRDVVSRR